MMKNKISKKSQRKKEELAANTNKGSLKKRSQGGKK